jgi:hypothetical protein
VDQNGQTLWLASAFPLWRYENVLQSGEQLAGFDRLYGSGVGHTTGGIDVHDVADDGHVRVYQHALSVAWPR